MKFGNVNNKIPDEWRKRPTDEELSMSYKIHFRWVKTELAYRLDQYIDDGYEFSIDEDGFDDLAYEMDEQMDWYGSEYIGDWLHDELKRRGYID